MVKISTAFKEALSHLPEKDKDKLILRLLKKDENLMNRLYFDLVETKTVEECREEIVDHLTTSITNLSKKFYSIGYLNMDVRYLSGDISKHVKITKDSYGEISLNLLLLNQVLKLNRTHILSAHPPTKILKFSISIIARVFKILLLIDKMDNDYLIEFEDDLVTLGNTILDNDKLMNTSIKHGLDINWLINVDIPTNIREIHKNLKTSGYLK